MKFTRDLEAISKLLFVLLLLTALIVGAVLSYLWVIGYYVPLDRVYPEDITVNITDYAFDYQNTSYFNVTIQCPTSYKSEETANITRIAVSTEDDVLHDVIGANPSLPYKFQHKGESQSFTCLWNWANYTGETIKIIAFVADGSGATFEAEIPLVQLEITDVGFDPTISVTHFNVTILNYDVSVTYLNITRITVTMENQTVREWTVENGAEVDPHLPYTLNKNSSETFVCPWNWAGHGNKNVTITVYTLQGFVRQYSQVTPAPIILEITDVDFHPLNTASFNVSVKNSEFSIADANITEINVTVDGISKIINVTDPMLPKVLNRTQSVTFNCTWSWAEYSGKNVTVVVQTLEGYSASYSVLPKALTITEVLFNPIDTDHFVVTVQNPTWLNFTITTMNVTMEGMASLNITGYVVPSLPRMLTPDTNLTFMCEWYWAGDKGKNVTITIVTSEGYITSRTYKIPLS